MSYDVFDRAIKTPLRYRKSPTYLHLQQREIYCENNKWRTLHMNDHDLSLSKVSRETEKISKRLDVFQDNTINI